MAKITIDVPNAYADELGYQSVISNPNYIPPVIDMLTGTITTPGIGEPTIPNPQSKADFLKAKVPKIVVNTIARRAVNDLKRTKDAEFSSESAALEAAIEAAIITT